ncbi:MAG: aspartate dehydrogenase [Xanthomonadaceae bacterium]|nr:aspartate dehydrogenase [Xanthomonadaceae bacterium]
MRSRKAVELRVALAGYGAIGKRVASLLDQGIEGLRLVAVSANNAARAEQHVATLRQPVPVLPLAQLAEVADVVVECAPAHLLPEIATPVLRAGKVLVTVSVGALLKAPELVDLAREHGGRIHVPSGALLGLDAVQAAALGEIYEVTMETRKPLRGLAGAPYVEGRQIDLSQVEEPLKLFEGSAAEAIEGFPANLNVAVALGLAGVGPENTRLQVWADPSVDRNTHIINVRSDSADLHLVIRNIPTDENPKTGRITALSIVATLRKMAVPLVIGT